MAKPLNIVLFMCDDLRWDALSGMGHPQVKTPHIDQLMKAGTAFTRCTIPGSTSGAVCMPSRAMVHTGKSLFELEETGRSVPRDHTLLGEVLREAGYETFHTGKWHNERESFHRSFSNGGNIFFGGMGDQWNMPVYDYDSTGEYAGKVPYVLKPLREKTVEYLDGDRRTNGRHATEIFVETACDFLSARTPEEPPFFLSVALTAPHDPRNAPQRFHEMYPPDSIDLPENYLAQHPHHTGSLGGRDDRLAETPRKPAAIREHLSDYYGIISHLDEAFGKLMEALEASGERENTIVVFTADHGISIGQHGLMGKQNLYEHSTRIPMILAGPGIPEGKRIDERILHYGLMPTLLECLEVEAPGSVSGEPFTAFFRDEGNGLDELYLAYVDAIRGLIQGDWKLLEYRGAEGYAATQLFNITEDPLETVDRAPDPDYRERVQSMRARLVELREAAGDTRIEMSQRYWSRWDEAGRT